MRTMPHINKIDNKFIFNLSGPKFGDDDVSVDKIIFDFNTLCNDDAFSHSISLIKAYSFDALPRTIQVIEQQQAIILIIEAELERF